MFAYVMVGIWICMFRTRRYQLHFRFTLHFSISTSYFFPCFAFESVFVIAGESRVKKTTAAQSAASRLAFFHWNTLTTALYDLAVT